MRHTRKYIDAKFARAMDAIGAPHGEAWTLQPDGKVKANVGVHFIDHNPIYGGYAIESIINEGGGESRQFGDRHPAAAFVAMLDGIIGAARYMKERKEKEPSDTDGNMIEDAGQEQEWINDRNAPQN